MPDSGPNGEIFFRHKEGFAGFVYRVRPDGTGLAEGARATTLLHGCISRDGRWITAWAPLPGNEPPAGRRSHLTAVPRSSSAPRSLHWSLDGRVGVYERRLPAIAGPISFRCRRARLAARFRAGGFASEEEIARLPGARRIDGTGRARPVSRRLRVLPRHDPAESLPHPDSVIHASGATSCARLLRWRNTRFRWLAMAVNFRLPFASRNLPVPAVAVSTPWNGKKTAGKSPV